MRYNLYKVNKKKDGAPISEFIERISDRLFVVLSIIDLDSMEMLFRASREEILNSALKPVQGGFDFILVDCFPQFSILTII